MSILYIHPLYRLLRPSLSPCNHAPVPEFLSGSYRYIWNIAVVYIRLSCRSLLLFCWSGSHARSSPASSYNCCCICCNDTAYNHLRYRLQLQYLLIDNYDQASSRSPDRKFHRSNRYTFYNHLSYRSQLSFSDCIDDQSVEVLSFSFPNICCIYKYHIHALCR